MNKNNQSPQSAYSDLTVLELANINGMYCGKMLAALGARVIKIEKPGGDEGRFSGPFAPVGDCDSAEASLSFAYLNTGKQDITLDLTAPAGKEIFIRLASSADVIIETFAPGTMDQLGIGYDALKEQNPGIIFLSITPFGQTGRHRDWTASSDLIVDAMGGCMAEVGYEGRAPLHIGYDIMANAAGMYGLFAVQAAYHQRLKTGQGIHIDISQQECVIKWRSQCLGFTQVDEHNVDRKTEGKGVRQGLVNCRDGFCYAMIAAKWKELMGWFSDMGQDISVFDDPKYLPHTYEVLTAWDQVLLDHFNDLGSHYTKQEFMKEGQRRKIPVGVVDVPDTLLDNEQYRARNYFVEVTHPVIGTQLYPGAPVIMSESPLMTRQPAPLLGQDTEKILGSLGYDTEQLKHQQII